MFTTRKRTIHDLFSEKIIYRNFSHRPTTSNFPHIPNAATSASLSTVQIFVPYRQRRRSHRSLQRIRFITAKFFEKPKPKIFSTPKSIANDGDLNLHVVYNSRPERTDRRRKIKLQSKERSKIRKTKKKDYSVSIEFFSKNDQNKKLNHF